MVIAKNEAKEDPRLILYGTMVTQFNLDLLPPDIRGKIRQCRQSDYELLGSAGYLWALCPNNPWHKELEDSIRAAQKEIFKG